MRSSTTVCRPPHKVQEQQVQVQEQEQEQEQVQENEQEQEDLADSTHSSMHVATLACIVPTPNKTQRQCPKVLLPLKDAATCHTSQARRLEGVRDRTAGPTPVCN